MLTITGPGPYFGKNSWGGRPYRGAGAGGLARQAGVLGRGHGRLEARASRPLGLGGTVRMFARSFASSDEWMDR